jgi:hypothetical protein
MGKSRYNRRLFDSCVKYYKKTAASLRNKSIFILFNTTDRKAFYSIAPLSRALHELKCDVCAIGSGRNRESIDALFDVWDTYEELNNGIKNNKTNALRKFIEETKRKLPECEELFQKPDIILESREGKWHGHITLEQKDEWLQEYRMDKLRETAKILWRDVYNVKPSETIGIGFLLIQEEHMLGHPLEDYLDSYQINRAMASMCKGKVVLSAYTTRDSQLKPSEKISDLRATLLGCEYDKEIDEQPFKAFRQLSKELTLRRLTPVDATFSTVGKGYPGKHRFGDSIGYPSLNKKTRWKTPAQMLTKFDFYPQTRLEPRDPQTRVAFTETLPIDIFIETNLLDWAEVRKRNQRVKDIMDKCNVIYVKGKLKEKYVTTLEVGLVKKDGMHRWVRRSDTDVRHKLNKEYSKRTGIRAGCMGNIPGGEAFVTPEYVKGIFVGDVVIAIDQSYPLSPQKPFVVECLGNTYNILSAPRNILKKFNQRKKEAWKLLMQTKKKKALPPEIIKMKEDNFENIGEFAINTNPKARLCDYLIVNEKIAKMMHIALGSGYEDDRSTDYHMDIVFNAPRQKLDVYGIDADGKTQWILKDGEFVG